MANQKYEFKKVDLVGHSVKFPNSELLTFFYPQFKTINDNVMIVDGPVIFKGKTEYLNRIRDFGYPVISVTSLGEYDLSDNRTLVNMTFTKWGKEPSARLCKYIDTIDYNELLEYVKIHWVTGRWTMKKYSKSGAFVRIAEAFITDTPTVLSTYINLLDDKYNSGAYMEKSVFSFLEKVASQTKGNSAWYNKILRQYSKNKRHLLKQGIDKYIRVNIWNKDLKVFNLLQDLNRLDKKWPQN